tara:strand:- start:82 stop:207 length:126 start_codon:yes stop_codon:yes gene_type:complete
MALNADGAGCDSEMSQRSEVVEQAFPPQQMEAEEEGLQMNE